ncbi:MAG TPA: rRNA maturation RNase YbeY [Anaerolineaceae bacterium]|nr:rRNA maturation RNase YbeY [Anaerolineaceae bacterium]
MIYLKIAPTYKADVSATKLKQAAKAAMKHQKSEKSDLTLVITDDNEIQELNRTYLDNDSPTDVLSFSSGELDPINGRLYLGDIIISFPRARQQSEAAGHPVENEMQLLVVHGVLHLLGHDHADDVEKARMWQAQEEILNSIGCQLARLPG